MKLLLSYQGIGINGRGPRDRKQYEEAMVEGQIQRWKQTRKITIYQRLESTCIRKNVFCILLLG